MKKIIFYTLIIGAFTFQLNAQSNVILNISHKLGDADFALNQAVKNNIDHDMKFTRLEYYISEISLIHDSGNETFINDLWILVNATTETNIDLGNHDITSLEKIKLHIGVDVDHNHLDPSTYPSSHPLAPKSPSMHWGWTAGYRFLALEGKAGSQYDQLIQLHALGDVNYSKLTFDLNDIESVNNQLFINIDADYLRLLDDIEINSGVIVHGDNLEAKECISNFPRKVFSQAEITSSTFDNSEINEFNVFPNPVVNGITLLKLDLGEAGTKFDLTITSIDGRQLDFLYNVTDYETLDFTNRLSGMYFINLVKEGQTIMTKKVFVK